MKIDVYDTYATSKSGRVMHFDVFVEHGTDSRTAYSYAQKWLGEIGENSEQLSQSHCNFCHSANADLNVQEAIRKSGYYILQMEGCPQPVV